MPWKSQGGGGSGGPWGGGGSGGGPSGPWGGGGSGGGGGTPPDFEDFIRKGQDRFKRLLPGGMGSGSGMAIVAAIVLMFWLGSGFYRVNPGEQGVVLQFGKWANQELLSQPGLHWHLPFPIETVIVPQVDEVRQIDIGFRARGSSGGTTSRGDVPEESQMLTGDQNIIDIDFTVQWKIANAGDFLFAIRDPESTIKLAAESAMREVIGRTSILAALTTEKSALEVKTRDTLQRILDEYRSGVQITAINMVEVQPPAPVADAFEDVQRARQDRETKINQARAYAEKIIPEARGEASRMLEGAEAYRQRITKEAEGEAQRFLEVYGAYRQNPQVTRRRIYLETVEKVLQGANKIIMDGKSSGVVPYLPLDRLQRGSSGTGPSN